MKTEANRTLKVFSERGTLSGGVGVIATNENPGSKKVEKNHQNRDKRMGEGEGKD